MENFVGREVGWAVRPKGEAACLKGTP